MLRQLRKKTGGIIAKLILLLLIAAFGLWGIGDIFRAGGVNDAVATMDGERITLPELEQTISRLQAQIPELTPEVAQSFPVRMDTLNRLINTRLIYRHFSDLGLHVSDDVLAEAVATDRNFAGADGQFDAEAFSLILRRNNLSEQMFLEQYRRDVQLALVDDTIRAAVSIPPVMQEVYYKVWAQKRRASLILVDDAGLASQIGAPDTEALEDMYARQKDRFYVPGKRVLAYISFDGNTLKDLLHAGVSEDELRTRYESQKDLYKQAELRSVEQFNFADKADAEAGEAALKEGKAPHEPVKLGEVAKDDLPDSVAGAVFKLKAGSITPPVESEFGWQIYRVSSITPAMTLPFSDVRDDIETAAIADMMEDRLNELAEALDDQLAQGATLEEALKANGLSELKITKLSVSEDTQAEGLEAEVLASGADLEEGEVSPVLLSSEHVYYLVKADSVTEGYTKAYDDVKGELEKLWRGQQERDLMRAKAQEVAGELRSSEDMIGAIANTGLDTVMSGDLQRDDETIGNIAVTGGLMTEIFRMPKYGVSDAYPLPGGEYAVAVVTDIKEAPRDAAAEAQLGSTIALAQRDAMFEAYLSALRKHYHVEVNVDLLMADMAQQGE